MGDSWFVGFSPTPVVRYTYVIRSGVQMCVQWDSASSHSPVGRSSVFTRSKIRRGEQMFERLGKKISASAPIASYYTGSLSQATLMTFSRQHSRPHSCSILGHTDVLSQAALTPNSKLSLYEMAVHTFVTFNGSNAYSLCKTLN